MKIDYWGDEEFKTGSLDGLVDGVLNVLYENLCLLTDGEPIKIDVYGSENESGPVVEFRNVRHLQNKILTDQLEMVLQENLPFAAGDFPCNCAEYCDQNHGEGPIGIEVQYPKGPELLLWAQWKLEREKKRER